MSKCPDNVSMQEIAIQCIRTLEAEESARGVDLENEQFLQMMTDIEKNGLTKPVSVIPARDADGDIIEGQFVLGDGLQRLTAVKMLGQDYIRCSVFWDKTRDELLEHQIIANIHNVKFKPATEAKAFMKWFQAHPEQGVDDLSEKLSKPVSYIKDRLKLSKLTPDVQEKIDNGVISLTNGVALTKLARIKPEVDADVMAKAVEQAEEMDTQSYANWVKDRVKKIRDARKGGHTEEGDEFRHPKLRSRAELFALWQEAKLGIETKEAEAIENFEAQYPEPDEEDEEEEHGDWLEERKTYIRAAVSEEYRGFYRGLGYCLSIDDKTWQSRQAAKAAKEAAREAKKNAEAAEKAKAALEQQEEALEAATAGA